MSEADESERALGRAVAIGLPVVGGASALIVGLTKSFGSAILVLAATALLSTIGLLWASLRTLSGDAPLPSDLEATAGQRRGVDALAEKKRQVLRALKDLENERALGKIDAADYAQIAARYRNDAKDVMREMEREVAPAREEAERLAKEYLKRRSASPTRAKAKAPEPKRTEERRTCASCKASNEPDASFCKGCGAAMRATGTEQSDAKA
jgi:hypothetical protein